MNREGGRYGPLIQKWVGILGKYKFVLLVLAAGVLLLLVPDSSEAERQGGEVGRVQTEVTFCLEDMEKEISDTLSKVEGAGDVSVVLTLRSGSRQVLAQDTETNQRESSIETNKSTVIISKGSGVQEAVLLQEIYPTFQGALVVCEGGDNPAVQLKIMEAVSALTGLSSDKISICKGK